jgi:hypothetical protein
MIGGTKQAELDRTAKVYMDVLKRLGPYYALMFLLDIGYNRDEIRAVADRLKVTHDQGLDAV